MDQLFDSLSEDWISQSGSPQSAQAPPDSPATNSPSQLSSQSQSRIPRYQTRPAARLSSGKPDIHRRKSSVVSTDTKKLPLSDKTPSTLNSFNKQPRSNGPLKTNGSSPGSKQSPKPQAAKGSVRSAAQDTVQHKPSQQSPLKAQASQGTPDWKRRLKSSTGLGDQQDLFSPSGLESVFRPPTIRDNKENKKGPRYQPSALDGIPSSPPPLPSMARKFPETISKTKAEEDAILRDETSKLEKDEGAAQVRPSSKQRKPKEPEVGNSRSEESRPTSSGQIAHSRARPNSDRASRPLATPNLPSYIQKRRSLSSTSRRDQDPEDSLVMSNGHVADERSRVTSGQTADGNEDLSPFFVSRQHTVDGRVDYAPVVDMDQVRKRMSDFVSPRQDRPSSPASDDGVKYAHTHSPALSTDAQLPDSDITSHSLPEDLSTGTQSFVANGGFINARRGGRSQEGSFLKRPLSPTSPASIQVASSVGLESPGRRRSIEASKSRNPDVFDPETPKNRQGYDTASSERPRSSGSPLKLFDNYDTFTNDRLQRRMSKFEDAAPEGAEDASDLVESHGQDEQGALNDSKPLYSKHTSSSGSRMSSFGEGKLDGFGFESFPSPPLIREQQGPDSHQTADENRKMAGQFRFLHSLDQGLGRDADHLHRGSSPSGDSGVRKVETAEAPAQHMDEDVTHTANGKRLPYSPPKDPRPKRRRTLRSSEEAEVESLRARHDSVSTGPPTSSILGRKRKDALYDSNFQVADPKVLAMRQILRPRNPTPSQSASHSRQLRKRSLGASETRLEHHVEPDISEHSELQPHANPLTQRLAGELANLAQDIAEEVPGSARKPSVNTADFFNEAQQIMQLIRSRGKPASEAIDEEEPETDVQDEYDESLYPESTKEEFSRPPSREGGSMRRQREPVKLDARVVSQLRKFEEKTDVGMTLSSSLKSLKIGQPNDTAITIEIKDLARQQDEEMESDLNIRIIERRRRNSSSASAVPVVTNSTQVNSNGSHSTSSGPSTAQSIPTNSSRGSRNKAVIAPETVAHLLSDQVGGMTFDHERQVWVKSRSSSNVEENGKDGGAESEMTDDELGAIPDLSVDELEELRRVKLADSPLKTTASLHEPISIRDHAVADPERQAASHAPKEPSSKPQTADGNQTNPQDESSAPSKFSRFASSGPVPETRATSWSDEAFGNKKRQGVHSSRPLQHPKGDHAEEVEHEISILEDRVSSPPRQSKNYQPRVVTVTFSSPLADQIDDSYSHNDELEIQDDANEMDLDDSPARKSSNTRTTAMARRPSSGFGRKPTFRSSARRMSLMNQSYIARPMSRLDEQDEMSLVHIPNGGAADLTVSTPLPVRSNSLVAPPTGGNSSVTFQLSPLPDFTVHQIDRPLDRFNAAQPLVIGLSQQVERQVSQATQEIVKKITDVEPYEPYWDYLRSLDLHERNLASLHMLKEFCGRLEELDVSNNQLRELAGAPSTLRHFRLRYNCLSNLTAWNHLCNLQYLDISGNQLQTLEGLQSLVHLRELKADDNLIEDIEGIFDLDGLIRLSLKRNRITGVDLESSNL